MLLHREQLFSRSLKGGKQDRRHLGRHIEDFNSSGRPITLDAQVSRRRSFRIDKKFLKQWVQRAWKVDTSRRGPEKLEVGIMEAIVERSPSDEVDVRHSANLLPFCVATL